MSFDRAGEPGGAPALDRLDVRRIAVFAGLGGSAAIVGPSLPLIAERLDGDVGGASLAVSGLFGGLLVGVVLAGVCGQRASSASLLRIGAVLQIGGLSAAATASSLWLWILGFTIVGVGFGITEVLATSVTARDDPSGRWLSQLGAVFAVSAIATPLAVSWSVAAMGAVWPVYLALIAVQGSIALMPARARAPEQVDGAASASAARTARGVPGSKASTGAGGAAAVLLVVLVSTYVGAEAILSTWTAPLTGQLLDVAPAAAAWGATGFWVALAIGRIGAARWLGSAPPARVLRAGLAAGTLALAGAAAVSGVVPSVAMLLVGIAVVAIGPVYALALTLAGVGGGHAPWAVARPILLGALGGLLAPAAVVWVAGTEPAAVLLAASMLLAVATVVAPWPRRPAEVRSQR